MSLGWGLLPTVFPGGVEVLGWDHSEALGRAGREKRGMQVKEEGIQLRYSDSL